MVIHPRPPATLTVSVAALLLALTVPPLAEESRPLDLSWMAGHWFAEAGGTTMEEHWSRPDGGLLLGTHRDVRPDGGAFFEFLRIELDGSRAVYHAAPTGRPAVPFALVESGRSRVVFENPAHDYPQRISYERDGERLTARIEGDTPGGPRASMWVFHRVPCPEW